MSTSGINSQHEMPMTSDRIQELLDRWCDLRKQGRTVTAEELCRDCPEALSEVRRGIEALLATDWLDAPDNDDQTPGPEVRNQSPEDLGLPRTLGRYRLNELVGAGGFGQVWRGFDPELQRVVAVKIPRADRMTTSVQMDQLLEEARKVARLQHPGIVQVFDAGRAREICFVVSELVEGPSLADWADRSRLDVREAAILMADVADALHYAHRQGFIHRDIKPSNILLTADGKPKLADFGVASSAAQAALASASPSGTLPYMAPEQLRGYGAGVQTDIYSLGVVLYQLLAGRLPFDDSDPALLRAAILDRVVPPLDDVATAGRPALVRVCLKCLAKRPEDRFPSAEALAWQLRAAVRRRPWQPLALVMLTVAIVALAAVWWLLYSEQRSNTAGTPVVRPSSPSAGGASATIAPLSWTPYRGQVPTGAARDGSAWRSQARPLGDRIPPSPEARTGGGGMGGTVCTQ